MPKVVRPSPLPKNNGPLTAKILGEMIRARRTQSGLRIEDAALLCHVSKDTLTKIENARSGVRFDTVLKICQKLGIELWALTQGENLDEKR